MAATSDRYFQTVGDFTTENPAATNSTVLCIGSGSEFRKPKTRQTKPGQAKPMYRFVLFLPYLADSPVYQRLPYQAESPILGCAFFQILVKTTQKHV